MYPAEQAPNLVLGEGVVLGDDVCFGANVIVHAGSKIGDGALIEDGAVVGRQPRLAKHSSARGGEVQPLVLGASSTVCCNAIVFAGAVIGEDVIIGDQAHVRERCSVGDGTVIGRGSGVDNDVQIGQRVRIQSSVYITAFSTVEDDVFVGPCAMTTNDDTMARHDASHQIRGATLRRACRIGGGVVIVPGVEVGEEAYVAAGAVVTRDVGPRTVVMGVPGSVVREVPAADLLEQWR